MQPLKTPAWAFIIWCLSSVIAAAGLNDTNTFENVNKAVPDGNASGLSDVRVISSPIVGISSVRVQLRIQGEFNGDLYGYLRHITPDSTNLCILLNRLGKSASNPLGYDDSGLDVIFDDTAANGDIHSYRDLTMPGTGSPLTGIWQADGRNVDPFTVSDEALRTTTVGSFAGVPASGEWTLFLADVESGGTNFLVEWGLEFMGIARPEITWPTPADIVYGTALGASQLNASSPVSGTFTYNPPAGTVLNAGDDQILTATLTPTDTLAYTAATTNVRINVLQKGLTITANDATRVYGAPETFTLSYNGFANGDTAGNLDIPPVVTTDATIASSIGSYPIIVGSASDPNYSITFLPGTLTIARAATLATLTSSANPGVAGQPVTFSLSVTAAPPSTAVPVGNVMFSIDGISTSAPLINGVATLTTSTLSAGSHAILAEYQGTPNFIGTIVRLDPDQFINTLPVAAMDQVARYLPAGAKVQIAVLLRNDSDADGHPVSFVSVAPTSLNGGVINLQGHWISYTAPSGFTNHDSFTYTISDGQSQSIGNVNIVVQPDPLPSPNLMVTDLGNGSYRVRFDGVPDLAYRVEYTDSLGPAARRDLGIIGANSAGQFESIDTPSAGFGQRFYRSVYP
jgi:subtilisin-like proprotein convertase family protein